MRLWTAMLGAWLAAGSSAAAEGEAMADRAATGARLDNPPAAERPADAPDRHAPQAGAPSPKA